MFFIDVHVNVSEKNYEYIFCFIFYINYFHSFKLNVYIALYWPIKNYLVDFVFEAEDWSNACGMTHTKINY